MNLINKSTKLFTLIIASGVITSSALAGGGCGGGGAKAEKIARYKTPQMVAFVDSTIDYLNSKEEPNKRHLKVLNSCLKSFNSGKKSARGIEAKNLKTCKNLMKIDEYDVQKIASNLSEDQIKNNSERPLALKKEIKYKTENNSERPVALKKEIKYKTEKITKTIDSTTKRDSGLLLF